MSVTYYYIRPGHFLSGLPARDMSEAEWNEQPADLRETALTLDLYQRVEEPAAATADETVPDESIHEQPNPAAE